MRAAGTMQGVRSRKTSVIEDLRFAIGEPRQGHAESAVFGPLRHDMQVLSIRFHANQSCAPDVIRLGMHSHLAQYSRQFLVQLLLSSDRSRYRY